MIKYFISSVCVTSLLFSLDMNFSLETKYGGLLSQGVTFNYKGENLDGLGLNFRIFQGGSTELIRGEVTKKGAQAVQGKAKLIEFDSFKKGIIFA